MPEKTPTHEIPYVPAETNLPEFTLRALILGILMAVVLGAANAYLGLRAGMTISATFPAAVIAIVRFGCRSCAAACWSRTSPAPPLESVK